MGGDSDAVEPDQQNGSVMYGIRLLIRHPSIDPADITSKLGLKPGMSSTAGAERKTPAGTRLPGVYKTSTWGYWLDVEGNRYFSKDILSLLLHLEERAEFIRELIDTGGSIGLYVELPGRVNIGDEIQWTELQRLASLKINFGVEVFPNINLPGDVAIDIGN